jgi:16S rRNA (uracil1498-N3)-methyltransferase
MEFFYYEKLSPKDNEIYIIGEEFKHLKAFRIQKSDRICIVNGKGLSAFGYVKDVTKTYYLVKLINFVENLGEIDTRIALALGILDNKERYEFAFEKAVEFRISEFFPLITKFTQKNKVDEQRLLKKGIAAMKQSSRSVLPKIHTPINLIDLMKRFNEYDKVLVFDREGNNFELQDNFNSILILIGPEGGFAESEIKTLSRRKKVEVVKICEYPLRSETAVVAALSLLARFTSKL